MHREQLWLGLAILTSISACQRGTATTESHQSAIIGTNDMVTVATDSHNLPTVAQALVEAVGRTNDKCTVFHLGFGLAATAGHCVRPIGPAREAPCQTLSIAWGARGDDAPSLVSRCLKVVAQHQDGDSDYAFLLVDPVPRAAFKMASTRSDDDAPIAVLGYPASQPLQWSEHCTANSAGTSTPARFLHDCDTLPGHSGSPVLRTSDLAVVGIHDGGDSINYGTFLAQTPAAALLTAAANAAESAPPETRHPRQFGPFGANEARVLVALPSRLGLRVSFTIDTNVEDVYDKVTVADGTGRIREVSGNRHQRFERLLTPVTIVFTSDYAGPSQEVRFSELDLLSD